MGVRDTGTGRGDIRSGTGVDARGNRGRYTNRRGRGTYSPCLRWSRKFFSLTTRSSYVTKDLLHSSPTVSSPRVCGFGRHPPSFPGVYSPTSGPARGEGPDGTK